MFAVCWVESSRLWVVFSLPILHDSDPAVFLEKADAEYFQQTGRFPPDGIASIYGRRMFRGL